MSSRGIASKVRRAVAYLSGYPLHRKHRDRIYLVYSMGKVGSSTVYHTLRHHLPFSAILHVHFLSDHWLQDVLPRANRPHEIKRGLATRAFIEKHPEKRLKVITLAREPVSRDISDLFENPSDTVGAKDIATMPVDEILKAFERKKANTDFNDYTLSWFDTELRNYLGIDIYAQPFPKQQGYDILRFEHCDVLVIRLEDLNRCYRRAFTEFAELDLDELSVANVASEKSLKNKVAQFKKRYEVSRQEIDKLYGSKYMTHFYSRDEIDRFAAKWDK